VTGISISMAAKHPNGWIASSSSHLKQPDARAVGGGVREIEETQSGSFEIAHWQKTRRKESFMGAGR
jgi:hypothetical protein